MLILRVGEKNDNLSRKDKEAMLSMSERTKNPEAENEHSIKIPLQLEIDVAKYETDNRKLARLGSYKSLS